MRNSTTKCSVYTALSLLLCSVTIANDEPTNAKEAKAKEIQQEQEAQKKFAIWVKEKSPEQQNWERILKSQLGAFYYPRYQNAKLQGLPTAWDFVQDDPKLPRILIIGDSISRAYTLPVRRQLKGLANVHRAPANCGPTANGLAKLDIWLGDKDWDIIHFNFGIHDRATPLDQYESNLKRLVENLLPRTKILVWANSTPIPDVAETFSAQSIVDRNKVAASIMSENGIPINNLFSKITPHLAEYQLKDDCHYTKEGNQFIGDAVSAYLKPLLEDLDKN